MVSTPHSMGDTVAMPFLSCGCVPTPCAVLACVCVGAGCCFGAAADAADGVGGDAGTCLCSLSLMLPVFVAGLGGCFRCCVCVAAAACGWRGVNPIAVTCEYSRC